MTGCIVIVKNAILRAPQIQSLQPNDLSQMTQNVILELQIDALTLGDEFLMHNTADVERKAKTMSLLLHVRIGGDQKNTRSEKHKCYNLRSKHSDVSRNSPGKFLISTRNKKKIKLILQLNFKMIFPINYYLITILSDIQHRNLLVCITQPYCSLY